MPSLAQLLLRCVGIACLAIASLPGRAATTPTPVLGSALQASRTSPHDLEVGGPLPGGLTRAFIPRERLLALPLTTVTNAMDPTRKAPAVYRGIPLTDLRSHLGLSARDADVVFAVCVDNYSKEFPNDYLEAFRSLLILEIDGEGPETWGVNVVNKLPMAPYYILATDFAARPSETVLGRPESLRYPHGVARLEFRTDAATLARIRLPGTASPLARQGQAIAVRECLACHGHDDFGGTMSGRPWLLIKTWASNTNYFRRYVVNPRSVQPRSRMPAFNDLEPVVLDALQAYFRELRVADRPR